MTDLQKRLQEKAAAYEEYTIACRRKIHGIAEVSNEEVRTSAFVEEELKGMGLPTHRPAPYTVIGVLDTEGPARRSPCGRIWTPWRCRRTPTTWRAPASACRRRRTRPAMPAAMTPTAPCS